MSHDRPHIYRAILEGLAMETLNGYEAIQEKTGITIDEIRVSGGASQSDQVLQILADVIQVPTVRMEVQEAAALGTAVSAAVGSGLFPTIDDAVSAMTHPKTVFAPKQENRDIYQFLYKKYTDLYPRIADYYKETAFILEAKDV
jgi:sugar (pentulose or hexulose) kinase